MFFSDQQCAFSVPTLKPHSLYLMLCESPKTNCNPSLASSGETVYISVSPACHCCTFTPTTVTGPLGSVSFPSTDPQLLLINEEPSLLCKYISNSTFSKRSEVFLEKYFLTAPTAGATWA